MAMWTKLRPGVRSFLATCAPLFEMCIYTHGDREYAAQMAKLLDPSGSLFADRIISQVARLLGQLSCATVTATSLSTGRAHFSAFPGQFWLEQQLEPLAAHKPCQLGRACP